MRNRFAHSATAVSRRRIFRHVGGWLLFLVYEQCLIWYTNGDLVPQITMLYFYGCNILAFYLFLGLLRFASGEAHWPLYQLVLWTVAGLGLVTIMKAAGNYLLVLPEFSAAQRGLIFRKYLVMDLFRSIYFMGLALLIWLSGHARDLRLRAAEAQKRRLIAERDQALAERQYADARNALLQQQLNPHLLFNSLNFVYSRVLRHSREGAQTVLRLAELMRYSMAETDPDGRVVLSAEVEQIRNLVAINAERFDFPLCLDTRLEGDFGTARIIPLILLTLAENIFKHARLDDPAQVAQFHLGLSPDGRVEVCSRNRKRDPGAPSQDHASVGLRNLRLRLAHSYPGNHSLDIRETATEFELHLILNL